MRKIFLVMTTVAFSIAGAQAQEASKPASVSLGVNAGIPTTKGLSVGYGADLQADFEVAPTTKITASAGFEGYSLKGVNGNIGIIPLLAGVKFNLGENAYAQGQLGYAVSATTATKALGYGNSFAYAPSIGYYFSRNFDASIKYLASSKKSVTLGSVNARLAYNF